LEFINRIKEQENLIQLLSSKKSNNEVLVITGPSGVGKSGLVRHVMGSKAFNTRYIRVQISRNASNAFENYHYLNILYKTISNYVNNSYDKQLKLFSKTIAFNVSNLIRIAIEWVKNKAGFPETVKLSEPIQQPNIIQKKDYIEKILSKKDFIVSIDNFQSIDVGSIEVIENIIAQTTNIVYILEYTLTNDDEKRFLGVVYESMTNICGHDNVRIIYINKLEFTEAQRLIPNNINLTDNDIINLKNIYDNSNGNLIHIILTSGEINAIKNPIQSTIGNLSKNARYLLEIIYWLETETTYNELFLLVTEQYTSSNIAFSLVMYENAFNELCTASIIESIGSILRWRHDSIITTIENHNIEPIHYLAYTAVKKYYLDIMQDSSKKPLIIERLFSLYIKYGDADVVELLTEVRSIILQYKYPNLIIDKLGFLEKKLINSTISHRIYAYETLAEICHTVGLADKAEEYLNKIYDSSNNYHLALRASILSLKYYIPNYQKELDFMANMPYSNPRLRLIISLCRLFSVMMASRKLEGKIYAEHLLSNSEYVNFIEYGILLRNYSELIDDIPDSINILKQALAIFQTNNCQWYEADVYIALSMLYAYSGDLILAEEYIQNAVCKYPEIEQSSIYNNIAVISILKRTLSKETIKNLNDALLINSYDYDRCIIKCNMLVYYCLVDDLENAEKLYTQIETSKYERYDYDEFKHIIYTNLLFFSECVHDFERIELYTQKLKNLASLNDVCESVIQLIKSNLSKKENARYFYSRFPYRVDFLGNWRFFIDKKNIY